MIEREGGLAHLNRRMAATTDQPVLLPPEVIPAATGRFKILRSALADQDACRIPLRHCTYVNGKVQASFKFPIKSF